MFKNLVKRFQAWRTQRYIDSMSKAVSDDMWLNWEKWAK